MREILFRGKRADNGEWVYGFYFKRVINFIQEVTDLVPTPTYIVDFETIGQYTGLTDKNGKKIFEGDILLTDLSNPYSVVVFKNGCFMQKLEDSGEVFYDIFYPTENEDTSVYPHNIVCGNIYDNPELLEGR